MYMYWLSVVVRMMSKVVKCVCLYGNKGVDQIAKIHH